MVSAEDSVKKYYQWLHLQRQWKKQYSEDPKLDAALHAVLQPEVLFKDGSDMSTIPFFIGVSQKDNYSYILLPEDFVPAVRQCVHSLMISRTNGEAPPPAGPLSQGKRYLYIRKVLFKNRASYFNTISELRIYNGRVRWLDQQVTSCQFIRKSVILKNIVIFSIHVKSEEKEIREIAWTMYDMRRQRVLDQHYIVDGSKVATEVGNGPIHMDINQIMDILGKDLDWADKRDKKLAVVAYDTGKTMLTLKHHGWTRSWQQDSSTRPIQMFSVKELYEVFFNQLGYRAPLEEILQSLDLPPQLLEDTGCVARQLLMAVIEFAKRTVPTVAQFGDLMQSKPKKAPSAAVKYNVKNRLTAA
ncbi:hypothetical protein INT43_005734 [Umbelopsis isabellina]|uniref:Uncharacterized protein n=1 Tax=Mortierella isabellina TaxID=91625 RepID=A0A8H7PN75_MORIS|nr:hypothetical protein INT43_005734 [Umbelopsis isabellina]